MKSLRTLLKLAQRDLETLRREMAAMITRQRAIEDRIAGHDQIIAREQALAQKDYESARVFGGFAAASLLRRRAMQSESEIVGAEIERIRELITAAHVETSKFERLLELEEAREKAKAEKREADELDEFATMRTARTREA
jgi:vacuolar-type H+-ATPase subunit D/Vma8